MCALAAAGRERGGKRSRVRDGPKGRAFHRACVTLAACAMCSPGVNGAAAAAAGRRVQFRLDDLALYAQTYACCDAAPGAGRRRGRAGRVVREPSEHSRGSFSQLSL